MLRREFFAGLFGAAAGLLGAKQAEAKPAVDRAAIMHYRGHLIRAFRRPDGSVDYEKVRAAAKRERDRVKARTKPGYAWVIELPVRAMRVTGYGPWRPDTLRTGS